MPGANQSTLWSRLLSRFNLRDIFRLPPAPLIDRGFGLIYDTQRDITWWKDPFAERFPSVPLPGPVLAWPVHDGDVAAELRWHWLRNTLSFVRSVFVRQPGNS